MDLTLERSEFGKMGVFGTLYNEDKSFRLYTLEHAYLNSDGKYFAKVPVGRWVCKRGVHKLERSFYPFETFEITDVPGHTGLLFHQGNYNAESSGCVLLGDAIVIHNQEKAISNSKVSFQKFMDAQYHQMQFSLLVL